MGRREATGTAPDASALRTSPGAVEGPPEATQAISAPAIELLGRCLARANEVDTLAQPAGNADLVPVRHPDRRLPGKPEGQAPQRPQEEPQGAALLLKAEGDAYRLLVIGLGDGVGIRTSRPPALHLPIRPRRDEVVGAREEALHQVRGRPAARRAGVEPAEENLDQRPRHLGGEDALGRLVEAADVQRTRMPERDRCRTGRKRIVDMDDVQLEPAEQLLERAAEVDGHRGRPRARPVRHGQARSHGQHRRSTVAADGVPLPGAVEEGHRLLTGGPDHTARLADGGPRGGGGRHHDPVSPLGKPGRDPGHELVHLVWRSPRMWAHLGDRQAVAGHGRSLEAAETRARTGGGGSGGCCVLGRRNATAITPPCVLAPLDRRRQPHTREFRDNLWAGPQS